MLKKTTKKKCFFSCLSREREEWMPYVASFFSSSFKYVYVHKYTYIPFFFFLLSNVAMITAKMDTFFCLIVCLLTDGVVVC